MTTTNNNHLSYEHLNGIISNLKHKMSNNETLRSMNQRAIQAKLWQEDTILSQTMCDLRHEEECIKTQIMKQISTLVFQFQKYAVDVTLARAGVTTTNHNYDRTTRRITIVTDLENIPGFDLLCLDAKERMYLILKQYDWLKEFFRYYPLHFYENSFQFVYNIPPKSLPVTVKVIGLGVGGSLALSGLSKVGIQRVIGYEKRPRYGPRSVTSRYQNASWRAYDIAENLLDENAFQHLLEFRQKINVVREYDGKEVVIESDRVQIILGSAIDAALDSATGYGAEIHYECDIDQYFQSLSSSRSPSSKAEKDSDIVALFTGAHTSELFPGLKDEMNIHSWPELSSDCTMWLKINESTRKGPYTTRGGEIGAEKWHYTIASSRRDIGDIERIIHNLDAQYDWNKKKLLEQENSKMEKSSVSGSLENQIDCLEKKYHSQRKQLEQVLEYMMTKSKEMGDEQGQFDYIFTNAPANEHNLEKKCNDISTGNVVIDGNYTVDVKIAENSVISDYYNVSDNSTKVLKDFATHTIVTGGDACVPPNPMAAYGATLACEFANMLVQLSVAQGHINAIVNQLDGYENHKDWIVTLNHLKSLFTRYYNARGRAENYFQFIQTSICNLYSLPPFYEKDSTENECSSINV